MIRYTTIEEEPMMVVEFGTGDIEISGFELDNDGRGYVGLKELDKPRPIGHAKTGKLGDLRSVKPTVLLSFSKVESIVVLIDILEKCREKMNDLSPEPKKPQS